MEEKLISKLKDEMFLCILHNLDKRIGSICCYWGYQGYLHRGIKNADTAFKYLTLNNPVTYGFPI